MDRKNNNIKEIYENSSVKSILNDYRRYNKSKYLMAVSKP